MAAFEAVPREYFHYLYDAHRATPGEAYEDRPEALGASAMAPRCRTISARPT